MNRFSRFDKKHFGFWVNRLKDLGKSKLAFRKTMHGLKENHARFW
jgi:hypothetical protein